MHANRVLGGHEFELETREAAIEVIPVCPARMADSRDSAPFSAHHKHWGHNKPKITLRVKEYSYIAPAIAKFQE